MKIEQLIHKKVAVWGYGVEGQASCKYLQSKCPDLKITVLCPSTEIQGNVEQAQLGNTRFNHDKVDANLLSQFDVVIKSPGISPYQTVITEASCQLISSTALWFSNESAKSSAKIIALTGTKGKSTSCAMLADVLTSMDFKVILAGNFGVPLIECLGDYDYIILETSSYQAQDGAIKADVAVLLNLYSEHLNWHLTEKQYQLDKWKLLQNAKQVIINAKDQLSQQLLKTKKLDVDVKYFESLQGFYVLDKVLMYKDKALFSTHGWQLKGVHNLSNAAAVCEILSVLGLDIKPGLNAIKQFKALPHRLETVGEIKGVTYINDSIASTPHATWAAMATVDLTKTIVLVGGFDRGVDWNWWADKLMENPPKMIICSGQNGKKIQLLILNRGIKTQCMWQASLELAVKTAKNEALSGDVVLLSPGAPSFDAFDNYQHRGQQFIKWVS